MGIEPTSGSSNMPNLPDESIYMQDYDQILDLLREGKGAEAANDMDKLVAQLKKYNGPNKLAAHQLESIFGSVSNLLKEGLLSPSQALNSIGPNSNIAQMIQQL